VTRATPMTAATAAPQVEGWPWLTGLATATPPLRMPQAETAERLGALWGLESRHVTA